MVPGRSWRDRTGAAAADPLLPADLPLLGGLALLRTDLKRPGEAGSKRDGEGVNAMGEKKASETGK